MQANVPKATTAKAVTDGRRESVDPTGEFPFDATDYVLHLVAAIGQFRDSALDHAMREFGLNTGRYRVLGVLNRFGVCSMTELANYTAMDRTTLTRVADHLVANELAARREDPKDRRHVLLEMTDLGLATYHQALAVVFDLNSRLLNGVPDAGRRAAARVLRQVVANLAPNDAARDSIIKYSREDED